MDEDGDEIVNLVLQRVLISPKQEAGNAIGFFAHFAPLTIECAV